MLQRKIFLACFIAILSLLLSTCKDNPVSNNGYVNTLDTSAFTYPFKNGAVWNYTRKFSAQNFRPDSVRRYFQDLPVYGSGSTTILYDTLINSDTTKCFFNRYTENSHPFESREYYKNTQSGLLCYAYRADGGAYLTPFKLSNGIHLQYGGENYGSVQELFYAAENGRRMLFSTNDTLIQEVPPVVCLKYPVVSGTQWLFKNIEELGNIYKKYIGFEKITIGTAYYSCIKTQRIWENYSDMVLYDDYSKFGILKRDYTVKDVRVTNEFGTLLGYADLNDLFQVTSFNLP